MNPFDQQKKLQGVKDILVVGSGKGGVGKSTLSLNLALALKKEGLRVGVLDGDIYGPSLPRLTGTVGVKPELLENGRLQPLLRYGLKLMSMGNLVEEEQALVWRGPMLFKAIDQFFKDVEWGELDVLVIDLPPGTGDVALSIAQKVLVSGAIAITSPQNMCLSDTKKACQLFNQLKIPLIGVVENMAYYREDDGSHKDLFPQGNLDEYLKEQGIEKLVQIGFHPHVALSSEMGVPVLESYPESEEGERIKELAKKTIEFLSSQKT